MGQSGVRAEPDRWLGIAALLVAVVYLFLSAQLPIGTVMRPGPGFFPLVLGAVAAVIGAGIALGWMLAPKSEEPIRVSPRSLLMAAAMLAAAVLLPVLGYVPASFLLAAAALKLLSSRGLLVDLGVAALLAVASFALFGLLLGIPLPGGILERWL